MKFGHLVDFRQSPAREATTVRLQVLLSLGLAKVALLSGSCAAPQASRDVACRSELGLMGDSLVCLQGGTLPYY